MPKNEFSAFCLGGVQSGSGKTTLTLALLAAFRRRGLKLLPGKCGPDYIDPGFHEQAAGRPSLNLDPWMMGAAGLQASFARAAAAAEVAVIEGVMGLFDGVSPESIAGSTADCARILGLPVILVVEARGMAGSIAALVQGFCGFHPEVKIAGVIANRVGSKGHGELLAAALKAAGLPPLLGALPKNEAFALPERHLGLVPGAENHKSAAWFADLAQTAEAALDLDALLRITRRPRPRSTQPRSPQSSSPVVTQPTGAPPVLALARDRAFHFYYPDNLALLKEAGFKLVEFSPLAAAALPRETRALYLGGGFPEVFAAELAANQALRRQIGAFAAAGGLIYAECGGFMYLGEALIDDRQRQFPMCGVVPGRARMGSRLQALGYREVTTRAQSFLGPAGTVLRGHEFHWSEMELAPGCQPLYRQRDRCGRERETGVIAAGVLASYIHLHFYSNPSVVANWAAVCRR